MSEKRGIRRLIDTFKDFAQNIAFQNRNVGLESPDVQSAIEESFLHRGIGKDSVQIGKDALSVGDKGLALGHGAEAISTSSVAIGDGAWGVSPAGVAIGKNAEVTGGGYNVSLGHIAKAPAESAYALGNQAQANRPRSYAIGYKAQANSDDSMSIGNESEANSQSSIAIGQNAKSTAEGSVAIGRGSEVGAIKAVAIGDNASNNSPGGVSIGENATAHSDGTIAIGRDTFAAANKNIALGDGAYAVGPRAVAIGPGATSQGQNLMVLGTDDDSVSVPGILSVGGNVNADGDLFTKEDISSQGDGYIGGELTVVGESQIQNNLTVYGELETYDDIRTYGDIYPQNLDLAEDGLVRGDLEVLGKLIVGGGLVIPTPDPDDENSPVTIKYLRQNPRHYQITPSDVVILEDLPVQSRANVLFKGFRIAWPGLYRLKFETRVISGGGRTDFSIRYGHLLDEHVYGGMVPENYDWKQTVMEAFFYGGATIVVQFHPGTPTGTVEVRNFQVCGSLAISSPTMLDINPPD